uniref:Uncharacterized protein n=1 Tax=Arundo donax TaxID=35708 RepID=A0A0A9ALE9_ARUDO
MYPGLVQQSFRDIIIDIVVGCMYSHRPRPICELCICIQEEAKKKIRL